MEDPILVYRQHQVPMTLSPCVVAIWSLSSRGLEASARRGRVHSGTAREFTVDRANPFISYLLPDGHVSLVVNVGDDWTVNHERILRDAFVIGPMTRALPIRFGAHVNAVGVSFRATHAASVLRVSARHLADDFVPIETLWGRSARTLSERASSECLDTRLCQFANEVLARSTRARTPSRIGALAVAAIEANPAALSVARIAATCQVSRQYIGRLFREEVGISPGAYGRIVRFQSILYALISGDEAAWPTLAARHGFVDQAHMIGEFRRLTGVTPSIFRRRRATRSRGNVDT